MGHHLLKPQMRVVALLLLDEIGKTAPKSKSTEQKKLIIIKDLQL